MTKSDYTTSFHDRASTCHAGSLRLAQGETQFTYRFDNFFHPFIGEVTGKLNRASLSGMLDGEMQALKQPFFENLYKPPSQDSSIHVDSFPKQIDVSVDGPYANYNWELFFTFP